MLFHKHKSLFFHVGKAAGSSVEQTFLPSTPKFSIPNYDLFYGWEPKKGIYLQHATAAFVQKNIHPRMFEEYFKFTVVRNPFTRLVSVFNYNHKGHTAKYETFENFILNLRTILNKTHHQNGSHYIDQVHYSHIENERVCDEVVFFEDLPHGFKVIQRKTKLIQPLKHINKGRVGVNGSKAMHECYSKEMVELMLDVYARDFDTFGYSANPRQTQASLTVGRVLKRVFFI